MNSTRVFSTSWIKVSWCSRQITEAARAFGVKLAAFAKGEEIVPDVIAAVDYLKSLESVDATHIGVIGFSFGGYLTLRSISQVPGLFAAAVDFFGASDVAKYYQDNPAMRDRLRNLLGGTAEQNSKAYAAASPINFVDRITTPLLILHGTRDDVVPASHSVELTKALKRAHKNYEFHRLPVRWSWILR
jgi:dipeptidyl aminopeptidase/acylaminoacyl peptidase